MIKFYSHIVTVQSLIIELDQMDLSDKEKLHLANLLDSTFHHTILDAILRELNEEDKTIFVKLHAENDSKKFWEFLNKKVDNIEDKIKSAAAQLTKELHKDIKEAKGLKKV
ncbi:hypothetical protein A2631_04065 [Candidatus Daviesbacteria bacterium RIFCSPHIGHO2_01_FULL_44_29]|uniref:Uncharacterized protein n=1 Tax=Candidatus Daviesbacteria bacterium RIFCSPHIGHO2_02_FULL_43_12 TaxID=1797776 RepID=A0A1F5KGI2_9BACT|nr:MAG: hypothetical protein A2631_04065 [Candidatus Daviesbacteria bacterium RIFCSPHIGHO2_01_FULL_44_29]OGE39905.1 MAG: hypothetical protein A3D25_03795 [Candidatus Daviesbacteria bacterium RIFCSPHIGHO2_02_FULL_43_12]OGE40537.1 MAG: hypothetical protein A3E86_00995 [Candidatus Daviesbacteria bacterium RIFCSPHIGHO2_12_FULL_47_45]OGE70414.1 MAG: hypothetical protein A3B55_01775 [Candidatus Daviesbacteria bacterium RIFCSPLOWO2_01_FULL_43_15]